MERRKFVKASSLLAAAGVFNNKLFKSKRIVSTPQPRVISTWHFGAVANSIAWPMLAAGAKGLDALEKGINAVENDPEVTSVGYGAYPDRDGYVTLDASIMNEKGMAGAVSFLRDIKNPISVARQVMEDTSHVMLSGDGAYEFARTKGFPKENLLTPEIKREWETWLKNKNYQPIPAYLNHDTVGVLTLDNEGDLSGGCSTSGLAYKMHGRVGDSPVIGAALFVDNEYGAAVCTGIGEMVLRTLTSFTAVEYMVNGYHPQQACQLAINRLIKKNKITQDTQVGIIALSKNGNIGAYSVLPGFQYFVSDWDTHELKNAPSKYKLE